MERFKYVKFTTCIKVFVVSFVILCLMVTAVPYALIKGLCNLEYYDEWVDFFSDYIIYAIKNKSWKEN